MRFAAIIQAYHKIQDFFTHKIKTLWDLLGFKKNVLFNTPILIGENAPNLLCGRKNELTELIQEILADERCVKVITGKTGVGKTSFLFVPPGSSQPGN